MKKTVAFLLIFGIIGYSIYLVAIPHYNYFAFSSDVGEHMRINIYSPEQVKDDLMQYVEEYDIPINKEDIYLSSERPYKVSISWEETVDFFGLYQKTFEFHIDTRK